MIYDETHPQVLTSCCELGLRMTPSVVKHPEGRCSVEGGFQKAKELAASYIDYRMVCRLGPKRLSEAETPNSVSIIYSRSRIQVQQLTG